MSAAVRGSVNVESLGSWAQEKAAIIYIIKYMVKEGNEIANSLSLFKAAIRSVARNPSIAPDTGTFMRTAQHILTNILNRRAGTVEYAVQTASLGLLGLPSNIFSHEFQYCFIRPAIAAVRNAMRVNASNSSDEVTDVRSRQETTVTTPAAGPTSEESDDLFSGDEEEKQLGEDINMFIEGHSGNTEADDDEESYEKDESLQIVPTGSDITVLSQHQHYRMRGPALAKYTLYNYTSIILIQKKPSRPQRQSNSGRLRNASFEFSDDHPLKSTHHQVLRSKQRIPILAGPAPPQHPGPKQDTPQWREAARKFAEYIVVLHCPWDLETGIPTVELNYESLIKWIEELDNSGFFPDQATLFWIENLAMGSSVTAAAVKLMSTWRARKTIPWTTNDRLLHTGNEKSEKEGSYVSAPELAINADLHTKMALDPENTLSASAQLADRLSLKLDALANASLGTERAAITAPIDSFVVVETRQRPMEVIFTAVSSEPVRPAADSPENSQNSDQADLYGEVAQEITPVIPPGQHRWVNYDDIEGLLPQQHAFVKDVFDWYNSRHVLGNSETKQLLELLSGAAGTGKSYVVKKIVEKLGADKVRCMSFQGIAASLLPGGQTIHSAFSLGITGGKYDNEMRIPRAPNQKRKKHEPQSTRISAREKFAGAVLIVIDEISNTKADLILSVDEKLREWTGNNAQPFGGLGVILMGDMFQIPPVQGGSLIAPPKNLKVAVGKIFNGFNYRELTVQKRQDQSDTKLLQALSWFRDPSRTDTPIAASGLIKNISTLSRNDFIHDKSWHDATIIVSENISRVALNKSQAFIFARRHNRPVISWRHQLHKGSESIFQVAANGDEARLEQIYDSIDELTFYFVPGAPAVIKDNISTSNGLANGKMCTLHSITLDEIEQANLEEALAHATGGEEIRLQSPPISVNVQIDDPSSFLLANSVSGDGKAVVPMIIRKNIRREITLNNDVARKYRADVEKMQLAYVDHGVDLGFALTYHKVQGRTLDKVIIDLNVTESVTVAAFYVAVSRVSHLDRMRFFPIFNEETKDKLCAKKFNKDLVTWWSKETKLTPFMSAEDDVALVHAGDSRSHRDGAVISSRLSPRK